MLPYSPARQTNARKKSQALSVALESSPFRAERFNTAIHCDEARVGTCNCNEVQATCWRYKPRECTRPACLTVRAEHSFGRDWRARLRSNYRVFQLLLPRPVDERNIVHKRAWGRSMPISSRSTSGQLKVRDQVSRFLRLTQAEAAIPIATSLHR